MYCFKCGEHIKDGSRTCNNCGATQPTMQQPQFRQAPPPQNRQQAPAELPASYIAVSWLTFAAFLVFVAHEIAHEKSPC